MAHSFGGGSSGGGGAGAGYSYATLSSSIDTGDVDARTCRSHTVSRFSRGYSILTNGRPKIDRRYSPPAAKGPRHRAETGPPSTLYSTLQSGLTLPRSVFSKSTVENKTVESLKKPTRPPNRRRSTGSRPEEPRYKVNESRKASTSKKSAAEKNTPARFSLSSMRSRTSVASTSSKRSNSSRKEKEKKSTKKSKKKSGGGYGMWGCFG